MIFKNKHPKIWKVFFLISKDYNIKLENYCKMFYILQLDSWIRLNQCSNISSSTTDPLKQSEKETWKVFYSVG